VQNRERFQHFSDSSHFNLNGCLRFEKSFCLQFNSDSEFANCFFFFVSDLSSFFAAFHSHGLALNLSESRALKAYGV